MDTNYNESSIRLLAFSILECKFEVSKVILLQFTDIEDDSFNDQQLKKDIDNQYDSEYYDNLYGIMDPFENVVLVREDISFQDVYLVCNELIKLKQRLLLKFKNSSFESIDHLFKHLYIIGLQCIDSKLINIEKLKRLFENNSILVYNSISIFFKTFYYLYLESWKLSNYFLSRVKNFNFLYSQHQDYSQFFLETTTTGDQNQQQNQQKEILSLDFVINSSFEELFLKLRKFTNNYLDSLEDPLKKEDINSKFKTRFYFDMQYLLNVKESSTILALLIEINSNGNNLKKINYLGFLNGLELSDGDNFTSNNNMDISSGNDGDLELFKSIVSLKSFKNRLLLEFALGKLRLDLVKLILSICKVKRVNEDLLKSIFSYNDYNNNNINKNELKNSQQDIAEFLLRNHFQLVGDSLLTSKFSIFTLAFLKPNLYLCKLIMRLQPKFVEIKVEHIKENVLNNNIQILEYFYQIGSNILKSRIKRLLLKYGNKKSFEWF